MLFMLNVIMRWSEFPAYFNGVLIILLYVMGGLGVLGHLCSLKDCVENVCPSVLSL